MILHFDEPVLFTEDVLVHRRRLHGRFVIANLPDVAFLAGAVRRKQLWNLTAETSRSRDDSLAVLGEQLEIHAWLVVEAFEICLRRELHEVAISDLILCEQRQVISLVLPAGQSVETRTRCYVRLDTEDRFDADGRRGLVEVDDAVEHAMVGDRDRWLAICGGGPHHVLDPRRTVEHRELGVNMEMGEAVAWQRDSSVGELQLCKHDPRRHAIPARDGPQFGLSSMNNAIL